MKTTRLLVRVSAVLFLLGSFTSGQAATVTVSGDDIDFTYDDATLFGEVTVIGNTFFFTPDNFIAESLNGEGVVSTNETLIVNLVVTTPGFEIDSLFLRERGDYQLIGSASDVSVSGQFIATSTTTNCPAFPCEEVVNFDGGALTVQNSLTPWDIDTGIDLSSNSDWGSDTGLIVTIENNLTATTTESVSQALIQKKFGGVAFSVNEPPAEIPIPAAVWLFGSGLLGLVAVARRRT